MSDVLGEFTAVDYLAAAIRRAIVTGQETPGQMAERILADPEALPDYEAAVEALEHIARPVAHGYPVNDQETTYRWMVREARAALARLREKVPA